MTAQEITAVEAEILKITGNNNQGPDNPTSQADLADKTSQGSTSAKIIFSPSQQQALDLIKEAFMEGVQTAGNIRST